MTNKSLSKAELFIDGEPGVHITVVETGNGTLEFKVKVIDIVASADDTPQIADLRGLFFHIDNENLLGDLRISGQDIKKYDIARNDVSKIGDVNMNGVVLNSFGRFDIGIEFGTPGIERDDIRETSFTLSSSKPLSLSLVLGQTFGARLTSVGSAEEERTSSLKLAGQMAQAPRNADPWPEDELDDGSEDDSIDDPWNDDDWQDDPADDDSSAPIPGDSDDDLIDGGEGNDTLHGGQGNDEVRGGTGDDLIIGGTDHGRLTWDKDLSVRIGDNLYGGDGNDTYLYKKGDGVDLIWDFQAGRDVIRLSDYTLADVAAVTTVTEVENTTATESHKKIALILNKGGDAIIFNRLQAPSGNDVAIIFADGKTMSAAQLHALAQANAAATKAAKAAAILPSFADADEIEKLTLVGGDDDDVLIGDYGDDDLYGGDGNNGLSGHEGNDSLYGGRGRDTLVGGLGDDIGYGYDGEDLIVGEIGADELLGGGGNDVIFGDDAEGIELPDPLTSYFPLEPGTGIETEIVVNRTWWGGFEGEITITATEDLDSWCFLLNSMFRIERVRGALVTGEEESDGGITYKIESAAQDEGFFEGETITISFTARTGVNSIIDEETLLLGLSTAHDVDAEYDISELTNFVGDTLRGQPGADTLVGGDDDEIFYVDHVGDMIEEDEESGSYDTVVTSVHYTLDAHLEDLMAVEGRKSINLKGNELENIISGNAGANRISGGFGNDILAGDRGKDAFVFDTALDAEMNVDIIDDFNVRDDTIHLDNAIFTKLGKTGRMKDGFFAIGAARDKNDHIIYDRETGTLAYDADGSGSGEAIVFAIVGENLRLTSRDFLII